MEDLQSATVQSGKHQNGDGSNAVNRMRLLLTTLEQRGIADWLVSHVASVGDSDDAPLTAASRKEHTVKMKVLNMALRCITQLVSSAHSAKVPLAVLSTQVDALVGGALVLLRKYVSSATELHRELVTNVFKLLRLLARRKLVAHCFDNEQLRVLVGYADQLLIKAQTNVYDHAHAQLCTCAFAILNLVAKRRARKTGDAAALAAINELFDRVKQLSLSHADERVRMQARNSIARFVNEAGLSRKQFTGLLEYFAMQLLEDADHSFAAHAAQQDQEDLDDQLDPSDAAETQAETVRASALEMLNLLVGSSAARTAKLNEALTSAFVPLCAALGNTRSSQLKRLNSAVLRTLLTNLAPAAREQLWLVAAQWLTGDSAQLHLVALLVLACFLQAEQRQFALSSPTRLETVVERVAELTNQYAASLNTQHDDADVHIAPDSESDKDRMLHALLTVVELLSTECDVLKSRSARVRTALGDLFQSALKRCLTHAHSWIRLVATRVFAQLLRTFTTEELAHNVLVEKSTVSPRQRPAGLLRVLDAALLRELVGICFKQLRSALANDALCEQVITNLTVLAAVVVKCAAEQLEHGGQPEEVPSETAGRSDDVLSLSSFARRINSASNFELVRYPQQSVRRMHLLKLIAAIFALIQRAAKVDRQLLDTFLTDSLICNLITPLHRVSATAKQGAFGDNEPEVTDASTKLADLANEALDVVKQSIGVERFAKLSASVETRLRTRRVARKRGLAQLAVTNPEAFARVKLRRNLKKRRRLFSKRK